MNSLIGIAIREGPRAPMQTVVHCAVSGEAGLAGDRRGKPGKRQVTVLSESAWLRACAALGRPLPWTVRRANLLVRGLEFGPDDVGRQLRIGAVILEVTGETDPCRRMDEACPGLRAALEPEWRGGVCCRVLAGGAIAVDDPVAWVPDLFR